MPRTTKVEDVTAEQLLRLEEAGISLSEEEKQAYINAPDVIKLKDPGKIPVGYKKCGRCERIMKIYMFNRSKQTKLGATGNCKECQKAASKKSYANNKENIDYKEYYKKNKEKKLKHSKEYYARNKETILQKQREYRNTPAGQKAMSRSHKRRHKLMDKNKGIPWTKELIMDRDIISENPTSYICCICNEPIMEDETIHMEHLMPIAIGGLDCFTNVGCAHEKCNLEKSKDAREITPQQVEELRSRAEAYIEAFPEKFSTEK